MLHMVLTESRKIHAQRWVLVPYVCKVKRKYSIPIKKYLKENYSKFSFARYFRSWHIVWLPNKSKFLACNNWTKMSGSKEKLLFSLHQSLADVLKVAQPENISERWTRLHLAQFGSESSVHLKHDETPWKTKFPSVKNLSFMTSKGRATISIVLGICWTKWPGITALSYIIHR